MLKDQISVSVSVIAMFLSWTSIIGARLISADATGAMSVIVGVNFLAVFLGLVGGFLYLSNAAKLVAPEYRFGLTLASIVPAVGALAYVFFAAMYWGLFDAMLDPRAAGFETTFEVLRASVTGILAFRYGLWLISAPLLVSLFPLMLNLRGADARRSLTVLVTAAVLMIVFAIIGEQQLNVDGSINTFARYLWGLGALLAYVTIVFFVFVILRASAIISEPEERRAYRAMSWLLVTVWLAYPVAYLVPAFFPDSHLMWLHLLLNSADLAAITTPGIVMLLAARRMTYKKLGAAASR